MVGRVCNMWLEQCAGLEADNKSPSVSLSPSGCAAYVGHNAQRNMVREGACSRSVLQRCCNLPLSAGNQGNSIQ